VGLLHRTLLIEEGGPGSGKLTHRLRLNGIEADSVDNAEKALELLKSDRYALCIIDLTLPTMEGWKTLRIIRGQAALKGFPCIAIIPFADSWTQQKIVQFGFTTYIYRQSSSVLVQQIRNIVQKYRSTAQSSSPCMSSV